MPKTLSPIIKIAKYTLTDEVRQRSFVVMFVICAIFVFLMRGCYHGNYMVNGQELDAGAVVGSVSRATFHVIAVGVMFLAALLSMRVFKRDRDEGMQSAILSKPITRWQYVIGKVLGLWVLSTFFMFILHAIIFLTASITLNVVMPGYLAASLLCSFNLLFVVVAVLLLSLLMPDIAAFLCAMGIGIISFVADGIFAISHNPMAQAMMQQQGSQSDWTVWRVVYYLWPKLSGTQHFASSFIGGSEGLHEFGSIYPLINILIYCLILGVLLFWCFSTEFTLLYKIHVNIIRLIYRKEIAMKKCPFCAEEIQDEAIKCKYCGSMLNNSMQSPGTVISNVESQKNAGIGYAVTSFILGLLCLGDVCRVASSQNVFSDIVYKMSGVNPIGMDAMFVLILLTSFSVLMGSVAMRKEKNSSSTIGLAIAGIVCSLLSLLIAFGIYSKFNS